MKDIQYRRCMCWKNTGISNPKFWNSTVKPAQALDPVVETNLSLGKGGNKEKEDIGNASSMHTLLSKLAQLEAEMKDKQEVIKQQDERIIVLEKENELLQVDQNDSAREKEFGSKNIPILNDVRVRTSKGDWKENPKEIYKSEPHQLYESNKDEPKAFPQGLCEPEEQRECITKESSEQYLLRVQGDQAEWKEINFSKGEQQQKTVLLSVMPESHKLRESEQHRK
eukprot:9321014-Ditylum_brightwellii.AAC.1